MYNRQIMNDTETAAEKTEQKLSSLCRPDNEKSCFACCPPIRPAGYDHFDFKNILVRELMENTKAHELVPPKEKIITGYTCWGLGYLDDSRKLIGCLLHPANNNQQDLRDLTGYGPKCRRELCREALTFDSLDKKTKDLTLSLAAGLDSFAYSSLNRNPTFKLLAWHKEFIDCLMAQSEQNQEAILPTFSSLDENLNAAADSYPISRLARNLKLETIAGRPFITKFKQAMNEFKTSMRVPPIPPVENRPYLHQLNISRQFAGFLRHALDITRATQSQADDIKSRLDIFLNDDLKGVL